MTLTTTTTTTTKTSVLPQTKQHQHFKTPLKRKERDGYQEKLRIKKCPKHLLANSVIPVLVFLCWMPDFIVALKDVSVTIPQAVKRGSNAMLTCNYDMENDTLYSVKWYKGRREFYRYTPKENPAMKVFPSQSGLNVERNLSNQSHVVLLAVPLNISGKFTCEISVEAPSFQTAMVSGEMEVVELPEEQATVTGIQPRYRIGDLVDGNCSIKYSKPAANLTWTINGIVVPPHHIKTYQIEKYEESNLESVMSAVHFMVTTQHFVRGQMRLKCTASIFDIFKEEIESIIEEDRPRIMASGQSYPTDNIYGTHGSSDGYEHNESYLTYFSAPKSSASPTAEFFAGKVIDIMKQNLSTAFQILMPLAKILQRLSLAKTLVNNGMSCLALGAFIKKSTTFWLTPLHIMSTALVILIVNIILKRPTNKLAQNQQQIIINSYKKFQKMLRRKTASLLPMNLWYETKNKYKKGQNRDPENRYQEANDAQFQAKYGQRQQYKLKIQCLVSNQNVVSGKVFLSDTYINTINKNSKSEPTATATATSAIDCRQHMLQSIAFPPLPPNFYSSVHLPPSSSFQCSLLRSSTSTSSALSLSKSSLSLSSTLGHRKTYAHDSFPLCSLDASKSNNAKFVSKNQILLMTFIATAVANNFVVAAAFTSLNSLYKHPSAYTPTITTTTTTTTMELAETLVLESEPEPEPTLKTSVNSTLAAREANSSPLSIYFRNNYLMLLKEELLLHQC